MQRWAKNSIRCVLAILLYFFAVTADVIAKAVVSDGYDANNPVVQIEHKCAGHWGKVTQKEDHCVLIDVIASTQAVSVTHFAFYDLLQTIQQPLRSFARPLYTPLLC